MKDHLRMTYSMDQEKSYSKMAKFLKALLKLDSVYAKVN
jgi:hypothetical protein